MVDVTEVAENIFMIDDRVCSVPKLGSVYILNEEKKALIDSGPPSSAGFVLDGIRQVGISPEDINYVIVTHIHLDHGGGAGVLLKDMPQAQVVVHHKGAKHLVEPAELVESAGQALGVDIIAQHGEVLPVAPNRVKEVHDGDTIELGAEQVLELIDAPGHAPHELCIYEKRNGGLFAGDAMGLYFAEDEILLQCHPPPSLDIEVCISTIERLKELNPAVIYFAHFGATNRVEECFQSAIDKLRLYDEMLARAAEEGALEQAAEGLVALIRAELEPIKRMPTLYEFVINVVVAPCITGLMHYGRRRYNAN